MEHRLARKEVNNQVGAQPRASFLIGATTNAAIILLLGACGSAGGDEPTAGTIPTTTAPGAQTAGAPGATLPASSTSAAAAVNTPTPRSTPAVTTATTPTTPAAQPDGSASTGGSAGIIPCAANKVVVKNCQSCHGATPIGGAPMSLMTFADFHAPAKTVPTMKVHELSKARVHDAQRPMPPSAAGVMPADEMAALDAWFAGGAVSGPASDAICATAPAGAPGTTMEGSGNKDGSRGRLTAGPGETCYEFKVHGSQDKVDDTKFMQPAGESYEQFYYKVPWPADQIATAYATIGDNEQILHHWLLFSTNELQQEGAHINAPLPTLIGTDPILLAGWAVGGPNLVLPPEVGMELPNPGRTVNVQWHFYNSTGTPQPDGSSVQICTVPKSARPNVGGITWMGTEDLNGNVFTGGAGMPPKMVSTFTTMCRPGRGDIPIHILGFEPHMHRLGKTMKTSINRMSGQSEVIFDEKFSFGNETHYFLEADVQPGETLTTSCTFDNDTDRGVPFGESTDTEMCYQFTFHYPAHALTNGAFSLLGVTDTCW